MKHALCGLILFLSVVLPANSQSAPGTTSGLPTDPRALLAAAEPYYDFASPELKPWHMKASYRFYDEKGKPAEEGTWEYWWASPKIYHSTWTRAGAERSEWSTANGALYRKESGAPLRYFERHLPEHFLSPLPAHEQVESGSLKLELKMLPADKPEFACVLARQLVPVKGKLQPLSGGETSYSCFDPASHALQIAYSNPLTYQYDRVSKTQERYLPLTFGIFLGQQKLFTATVSLVQSADPQAPLFVPPADAVPVQAAQAIFADGGKHETLGELTQKTQPEYPSISKMKREQGIVVLGAVIGADGLVHDLEVIASPSPQLAESARDAVKRWKYKPYLLNGVPVEVETIVNVIYTLGG